MSRPWVFVLCFLLFSASGLGQSTTSESQGMQALVAEVRQLREDLHTTNGYALKAQVLLYRLQVQEATVARFSQHLNDVRSKLAAIEEQLRAEQAKLDGLEDRVDRLEKELNGNPH